MDLYLDGFRSGDHALILSTLTDDVVWDFPGFRHLRGKAAFDTEIENEAFVGRPTLRVDRLVEEGETVAALFRFAFCDIFTFAGDSISPVESYLVPLGEAPR